MTLARRVAAGLALLLWGAGGGAQPAVEATHLERGRELLERGAASAAIGELEIAARHSPRPYLAWHLLGRAQALAGDPLAALAAFDEALARAPQFVPAQLGRVRALLRLGRVDEALAALQVTGAGLTAPAALLRGEALLADGCVDEAGALAQELEERPRLDDDGRAAARMLRLAATGTAADLPALRALVSRRLDEAFAYLALGVLEDRAGDAAVAAEALATALEIDDQDPTPWLVLRRRGGDAAYPVPEDGLAATLHAAAERLAGGDPAAARQALAGLLQRRPRHVPARRLALAAAEAAGDPWLALAGYRELSRRLPGLAPFAAGAARAARLLGASDLAECLAAAAVAEAPEDARALALLGAAQAEAGHSDAAVATLRRAVECGADDAATYAALGRASYDSLHLGAALDAYRAALERDPGLADSLPDFALSALGADETATLEALLESRLAAAPDSARALEGLGRMASRAGDEVEARRRFERLVALRPEDSRAWYLLAHSLRRLGESEAADAALARFAKLKAGEDADWERHNAAFRRRQEAEAALASGRPDAALAIYFELAAAGLATADDHLAAGATLLERGEAAASASWFERLLATAPADRRALAGLAEAAERAGDAVGAARARSRLALLACPGETAAARTD